MGGDKMDTGTSKTRLIKTSLLMVWSVIAFLCVSDLWQGGLNTGDKLFLSFNTLWLGTLGIVDLSHDET
jgi:hypothetical protein